MKIRNHLTFKNSKIWPDNSHIRWEMDGKGFVGNKQVFQLRIDDDNGFDNGFVSVLEPGTLDGVKDSPLFWGVMEIDRGVNLSINDDYHNARRSAMQWAEDSLMEMVENSITTLV
jgi:hypothetical protein